MRRRKLYVYRSRRTGRWRVFQPFDVVGPAEIVGTFATHAAALNFALWKTGAQRNYGADVEVLSGVL